LYVTLESVTGLVDEADRAMQRGDFGKAAFMLRRATDRSHNEATVHLKLATALRATGDLPGALLALATVAQLQPDLLPAQLMTANIMLAMGRREQAAAAYARAIENAPDAGHLPASLRAELARGKAHVDADRAWRAGISGISIANATPTEHARINNFRANVLAGPRRDGRPEQFQFPHRAHQAFFDPAHFAGVAAMEAATDMIIQEFRAVIAANAPELVSMLGHAGTSREAAVSGKWSSIRLIAEGSVVQANARLCPQTMALYRALPIPKVAGRSPNLMFSLLDARTKIPAHYGVTNTRLVLHIPLVVPPTGCAIRVGTETRTWTPGRALIFDDTFEHEAWNDSDDLRVVLLGDIWHPALTSTERDAIAGMMAV
jgi:Aspartyl/Asparaginyl beta-hydroxylase